MKRKIIILMVRNIKKILLTFVKRITMFHPFFSAKNGASFREGKEDIRRMERTLSMNYPVLRQNKRVLLNTFVKKHCLKSHHCTLIREARRDR